MKIRYHIVRNKDIFKYIYTKHSNDKVVKLSNPLPFQNFRLDFQKVDQNSAGKWLIHGTKHHKDNLELPRKNIIVEYLNMT